MARSRTLVVQIHLDRAPELDVDVLIEICEEFVDATRTATEFRALADETMRYRDLAFQTGDLKTLWSALRPHLYDDPHHGALVSDASIAVCQGDKGWDDYLLLHHFDLEQPLDSFS